MNDTSQTATQGSGGHESVATRPVPRGRTAAQLLDEIQRLTRYEGHVEMRTAYYPRATPANSDRPMSPFSNSDGDSLPYYACLKQWGYEAIGHSWEEALDGLIEEMRRASLADPDSPIAQAFAESMR